MAAKIRKGDQVVVRTGRYKNEQGEVLRLIPKENRAVVQGINMMRKHQRPTQNDPGGIKSMEAPIQISNLALVDPKTGKATRVGFKINDDGTKVRIARKSGEVIDG